MRKVVQQYAAGQFRPWNPSMPVATWQDTVQIHYGDGREPETVNVKDVGREPYVVTRQLTSVENWSQEDLAACFLYVPADFMPSDGMQRVAGAEPEYVIDSNNQLRERYPEEKIPAPPPPEPDASPLDRLAKAAGLSKEQLAEALVEAGEISNAKAVQPVRVPQTPGIPSLD